MMNYTGVTARIMNVCEVMTGRMYGGLAQVNVLLSTLMGGLSGSNLADAAMEAKMLVPEMEKKGFSKEFSSVVTATSAMITPLIPPGISMILYGCYRERLDRRPLYIGHRRRPPALRLDDDSRPHNIEAARLRPDTHDARHLPRVRRGLQARDTSRCFCRSSSSAASASASFTATEAGAVAIVYAVMLGFIYREMRWEDMKKGFKETVCTTLVDNAHRSGGGRLLVGG